MSQALQPKRGPTFGSRRAYLFASSVIALVSFLPFLRVFLLGQSFYFRDLSGQFFPARRFVLDGLLKGEVRFWNPFVHQGVPLSLSPFGYLPDVLQMLAPNEFGISLLLALHIPFAAVAFLFLARDLELSPTAGAVGAFIYALGGFSLSTINLYVYVQTLAWAPLFILAFKRAVESATYRAISLAALTLAMMISTSGLELALQACALAVVIAPPINAKRFLRSAACALLGVALAAPVIGPMLALTADSERGAGLATAVVLANSVHPLAFVQVLIAGFFGDPSNLTASWWGVNFFPRGFPYIISLYLGPAALALACAGAMGDHPVRRRLGLVAFAAAFVCLGRYAGWETFFDLSPSLRLLRFPVKAFFSFQFAVALLAAFAVRGIESGSAAALRRIAACALAFGAPLVALLLAPRVAPAVTSWFMKGFLPASVDAGRQALVAGFISSDAATSGIVAVFIGLLCFAVTRGMVAPSRAAAVTAALLAADLIRAGAGLNPSVAADFYRLSPEMSAQVALMRSADERVFTCYPESSQGYWQGRRARGGQHEAFTMATMLETLTPDFNVSFGVRTALSIDRTMLVPTGRVLSPELANCTDVPGIIPALREAGVTRVISLDPLTDPNLQLLSEVAPLRITPAVIHIYALDGAAPRFSQSVRVTEDTPNHLAFTATSDQASILTIRDPYAEGWTASVNGAGQVAQRTPDGFRALSLSSGSNEVQMTFEPPGLRRAFGVSLVALLLCVGLWWSGRRPPARESERPSDPPPVGASIFELTDGSSLTRRGTVAVALGLLALVWSNFAFVRLDNFGGYDEWLLVSLTSRGIIDSPYSNRPFNFLWTLPGGWLTPNSFKGFSVLHVTYLWLWGICMFWLCYRLIPGPRAIALMAAIFTVCWMPMDLFRLSAVQGTFYSGFTLSMLLAALLYTESWMRNSKVLLLGASALAYVTIRGYEAAAPFLTTVPFWMLWRSKALPRKRLIWIAAWVAPLLIGLTQAVWPMMFPSGEPTYQSAVWGGPKTIQLGDMIARFFRQYSLHLAPLLRFRWAELSVAAVALSLLVFAALFFAASRARTNALTVPGTRGALVGLMGAGLGLAACGYSALIVGGVDTSATRMQFYATPGIALFLAAAICLMATLAPVAWRKSVIFVLTGWVVAAGAGRTFAMQGAWDRFDYRPRQTATLRSLTEQVPDVRPGTLFLLVDDGGAWPATFSFRHAVELLYPGHATGMVWKANDLLYPTTMDSTGVTTVPWPSIQRSWRMPRTHHRFDEVVIVRSGPSGALELLDQWPADLPPLPPEGRYTPHGRVQSATSDIPARRILR